MNSSWGCVKNQLCYYFVLRCTSPCYFLYDAKGKLLLVRTRKKKGNAPVKGEALEARLAMILAEVLEHEPNAQVLSNQVHDMEVSANWMIEKDVQFFLDSLRPSY